MITVIAVGKKHEDWVSGGIKRYQTRCKQPWSFEWQLIPHSKLDGQQARQEESERILARLHAQDFIILLDERGQMFDSPALSRQLNELFVQGKNITIVIGGAFGVSAALTQRAGLVTVATSLSASVGAIDPRRAAIPSSRDCSRQQISSPVDSQPAR